MPGQGPYERPYQQVRAHDSGEEHDNDSPAHLGHVGAEDPGREPNEVVKQRWLWREDIGPESLAALKIEDAEEIRSLVVRQAGMSGVQREQHREQQNEGKGGELGYAVQPARVAQYAPRPERTAGSVLAMIEMSSQMDQFSR